MVVCLSLALNSRASTRTPLSRNSISQFGIEAAEAKENPRQDFGEAFSGGGSPAKILVRLFPTAEVPPKFWGRFLRRRKSRQKFNGSSRDAGRAAEFLKLPVSAVLDVIWRNWFRFFVMFAALRGNGHYQLARPSGRLRRGSLRKAFAFLRCISAQPAFLSACRFLCRTDSFHC